MSVRAAGHIVSDIDGADAVVVAQSSPGTAGAAETTFHLAVQASFKGD